MNFEEFKSLVCNKVEDKLKPTIAAPCNATANNDFKYLIPFELAPPVVKSAQPIGANADLTPISIVLP